MRMIRCVIGLLVIAICACIPAVRAQSSTVPPPAASPSIGWNVSISAGYSLVSGAQNNNGFFSSVASNLGSTKSGKWLWGLRGDYFTIITPASYVVTGGPEIRTNFSDKNFMSGKVFQPFLNIGAGVGKPSTNSGGGSKFAFKVGGGLDIPVSSVASIRLIEFDYIRCSIFPNGQTILSNGQHLSQLFQNGAQIESGIKFSF